jgi:HTH-type transcriptional repressor of NAD biosynthesis genes
MVKGLVIGKFMPFHNGHISLIEFARKKCDELVVLVCVENREPINADIRYNWVKTCFSYDSKIRPVLFTFDGKYLPATSVASRAISKLWADAIKKLNLDVDVIISSEQYGQYVAECMNIPYIDYDINRKNLPISATQIRENPYKYWDKIPSIVQKHYFKKICIVGTESTGKTTLAKKIAQYLGGYYVCEMGREMTGNVYDCTYEDLVAIAHSHAKSIMQAETQCEKLLIIDTDINITKSYCRFLFNRKLEYESWVDDINKCDLYLFLDNDVPHVQDGTRLTEDDRNRLREYHIRELNDSGIKYHIIKGDWDERFKKALELILNNK